MKQPHIAVLFGGCSSEHDVSLQSAYAVLSHIDHTAYTVYPIGITEKGDWFYYTGPYSPIADGSWSLDRTNCHPCALSPSRETPCLLCLEPNAAPLSIDAVFPILHGKNGEDGTVQGMFDLCGIPIIGCGTLASALCMDKDRAHRLAASAGIAVPKSAVFSTDAPFSRIAQGAAKLEFPLFVKPLRAGSSFGISKVREPSRLEQAVQEAFRYDSELLLEEAIPGFEVGCAVMGNEILFTGQVDEIQLSGGFFDFAEKYSLNTSQIHCPARISPADAERVKEAAKTIYRALGCRVFARVDLFFTPDGTLVFNEVNTIPGFTAHSRYPNMMKGAGWSFSRLIDALIRYGLQG